MTALRSIQPRLGRKLIYGTCCGQTAKGKKCQRAGMIERRGKTYCWTHVPLRINRGGSGGASIVSMQRRHIAGKGRGTTTGITPGFEGHAFKTCQFIAGDPRTDQAKCGAQTTPGSSYCAEHDALCHVPLNSSAGRKLWATTKLAAGGA